jgi:hypothetical protein
MTCPFCHTVNSSQSQFCAQCAARLAAGPGPAGGLPDWETRGTLWNVPSFFITIQQVLFSPSATFRGLKRDSAIFNAFLFGLIGSSLGGILGALWNSLINVMGVIPQTSPLFQHMQGANNLVIAVFLAPLFSALGLFIGSGVLHVLLMLVGGANRPYAITFKVMAYASGATGLLNIVPVLGSIAAVIWLICICVLGLKEAHETTTGRALLAVLMPLILCCACAALAGFALVFSGLGLFKLMAG